MTWLTVNVNVNVCLLLSTDLLRDYENNPPNPQQANIDAFLSNLTQPGGPVEAAFEYLHIGHFLPQGVVWLTLIELFSN